MWIKWNNLLFGPFQGVLHFQVETEGLSWSYIFGQLERNRTALNIVDYSVSQTTLEQVNKEYFFRYQNPKKGLKHEKASLE